MGTETTLVLSFLTTSGNNHTITIHNPKSDLTLSEVMDAMQAIIESEAFLTSKGEALESVNKCYYRTVTKTPLTDPNGE